MHENQPRLDSERTSLVASLTTYPSQVQDIMSDQDEGERENHPPLLGRDSANKPKINLA